MIFFIHFALTKEINILSFIFFKKNTLPTTQDII